MAHLDRLREAMGGRLRVKEPVFAATLLFVIVFAALAEALGLHFIVGAFFGSVLLSHELLGRQQFEQARRTASAVSMGFLAPLFFASIGLAFDPSGLTDVWLTVWSWPSHSSGRSLRAASVDGSPGCGRPRAGRSGWDSTAAASWSSSWRASASAAG